MAYLKLRSDVEIDVRYQLADPNDYDTYPDASDSGWDRDTIIFWFNKGIQDIRRKRPESKLNGRSEITYVPYTTVKHTADSYSILSDDFYNLIVSYICWKCLSQDNVDEYSAKRANEFQSKYYAGV